MPPSIAAAPTSVAAFIGSSLEGPINAPTPVKSFAQYQAAFGLMDSNSELGFAVQQFFSNGGSSLHVVRVEPGANSFNVALESLNKISGLNLLCLPGVADLSILSAAKTYCESKKIFLIMDAPAAAITTQQLLALVNNPQFPKSESAALYAPWLEIPDPLEPGGLRTIPPSGAVAGVVARTDSQSGVWKAPAGSNAALTGVTGLTANFSDAEEQSFSNSGLNLLRVFAGQGVVVWGDRTLAAQSSDFKYISVRRLAQFLEQSIFAGTQWVVFEPNAEPLWAQIRLVVSAFLQQLFRQGAFQGSNPSQAYFVKCDSTTMTQNDLASGILNIQIGFAPLKPAEFVDVNIQHFGLTHHP